MKNIKYILILQLLFAIVLTSCKEEEDTNPVFDNDAVPRIFGWSTANIYTTQIEDSLALDLSVSPSDGAAYQWFIDGQEVSTDQDFKYLFKEPKNYTLKFAVTRNGVTNSREAEVIVIKPFVPKTYNKKMIGFLTKDGSMDNIDFANLTHLVISSAVVGKVEGQESLVDTTFAGLDLSLIVTAAHNAGVYVMLDVTDNITYLNAAGMYGDVDFYNLIANPETRKEVIATIIKFATDNKLDGINIYLNDISGDFFNDNTLKEFFSEIPASLPEGTAPDGEFFYSVSVHGGWSTSYFEPIAGIEEIDWFNILSFRNETLTPSDHSSFAAVQNDVNSWKSFGVTNEKLVVGVPAFGLRYAMPTDGTEVGWGNLWMFATYLSYKDILAKDPEAYTKNKLEEADGIFYDGHSKIKEKADFVLDNDLGGLMIWSLESDTRTAGKSLLEAANTALGNPKN